MKVATRYTLLTLLTLLKLLTLLTLLTVACMTIYIVEKGLNTIGKDSWAAEQNVGRLGCTDPLDC